MTTVHLADPRGLSQSGHGFLYVHAMGGLVAGRGLTVGRGQITFSASTLIPAPAEAVFDWHEAPGAFQELTPPREPVRVLRHVGGIKDGAQVSLRVGPWPFALRWDLEHRDYRYGRSFSDVQVKGPFRSWRHVHEMIPDGPDACRLVDTIDYELPFGWLGRLLGRSVMQRKLKRLFEFRHRVTLEAFGATAASTERARQPN